MDTRAVYLMGFSAGASMAYALSLNHPEAFAGAIAFSGSLPAQLAAPRVLTNAASRLSVCIVHGSADARMRPALATEARDPLGRRRRPRAAPDVRWRTPAPAGPRYRRSEAIDCFRKTGRTLKTMVLSFDTETDFAPAQRHARHPVDATTGC